jgi:phosphoglycolate phosphatase
MKLAIFDVDGTLVDSRRAISECMDRAFEKMGLQKPGYDATRRIVGLSLQPAIAALAPDLPQSEWPRLTEAYREGFLELRAEGLHEPLYDGSLALLERLTKDGWMIGMATGKSRRGVNHVLTLHGLAAFFDATACADDGPGKPDPFMVQSNLRDLKIDPARAVMIGDTSFDMEMGRAAGVHTLGVTWGFHTPDEIKGGGAHELHDTFDTLTASLDSFAGRLS